MICNVHLLWLDTIEYSAPKTIIYNDHPASMIALEPVTLLLFAKHRICSATSSTVAKRFSFVLALDASCFS